MGAYKYYNPSTGTWEIIKSKSIIKPDGSLEYTPDDIKEIDNKINNLSTEVDEHKADYAYQTPTIVGTQIRISKQSNTDRLYFKLDNTLIGSSITISLDGGISELPLKDVEGNNVTELEKGFVEVVAEANFFTLRPRGGKKIDDVDYTITSQGGQFVIPKGQHSGNGVVKALFANLVPENIKKGVNIGEVIGLYFPNMRVVVVPKADVSFSLTVPPNSSNSKYLYLKSLGYINENETIFASFLTTLDNYGSFTVETNKRVQLYSMEYTTGARGNNSTGMTLKIYSTGTIYISGWNDTAYNQSVGIWDPALILLVYSD